MQGFKGYYSLIQYCPDASRAEAANVGVALFCPERGFLEACLSEGNDRIARFFGRFSFDPKRVLDAKQAIANRLRVEKERFRTLEDFTQFVETRANDIRMTSPRSMKVLDPATALDELFKELVGVRQRQTPQSRLTRRLNEIFSHPVLREKIQRDVSVVVPITGAELKAQFAYQNGVLNLVQPLSMTERTLTEAMKLTIDDGLIRKHQEQMERPARLVIALARPVSEEREHDRRVVENLFRDYEIKFFVEEQLEDLEQDVEATAHD